MRNTFSIEDRLKVIPFPDPTSQVSSDPIQIIFVLPEYVYLTEDEELNVAVWDEEAKIWSFDLISDT